MSNVVRKLDPLAETEVVASDRDSTLARWRRVVIIIFHHETRLDALASLERVLGQASNQHPEGIGLLTIVEQDAPLPPNNVRDALANVLRNKPTLRGSAVVFEGKGFRAAAVRGVATGLSLIARPPFDHRVFANAQEAVEWLMSASAFGTETSSAPRMLLDALTTLRAEED